MTRPATPFGAHFDTLLHGFRTALPQVAAVLQFMPDALLDSLERDVHLLSDTMAREKSRRREVERA